MSKNTVKSTETTSAPVVSATTEVKSTMAEKLAKLQALARAQTEAPEVGLTALQGVVLAILDMFHENAASLDTAGWVTIKSMVEALDLIRDELPSRLANLGIKPDAATEVVKSLTGKDAAKLETSITSAVNSLRADAKNEGSYGEKGEKYTLGEAVKLQPGVKGKASLYFNRNRTAELVTAYMTGK